MKTQIYHFVLLSLIVSSCINPIEQMKDDAISEIKEGLLDPKSFELIQTEVDTLHYSSRLNSEALELAMKMNVFSEAASQYIYEARIDQIWERWSSSNANLKLAKVQLDSANFYKKIADDKVALMEKLKGTPQDSVIGYTVDVRYYATTRGGNKSIGEHRYFKFNNGETKLEDLSPLANL